MQRRPVIAAAAAAALVAGLAACSSDGHDPLSRDQCEALQSQQERLDGYVADGWAFSRTDPGSALSALQLVVADVIEIDQELGTPETARAMQTAVDAFMEHQLVAADYMDEQLVEGDPFELGRQQQLRDQLDRALRTC